MKIKGRTFQGPNIEYIVIPRPDGPVVFKATAITNMKPFDDLVPVPKPRMRMKPGGIMEPDPDDKAFAAALSNYAELKFAFTILESLKESEIEWETVVYTDPSTWLGWEKELQKSFFTPHEIQLISHGVLIANSLSETKLEAARKDFLASLGRLQDALSSPTVEQSITLFGGVANASASGPQESATPSTTAT